MQTSTIADLLHTTELSIFSLITGLTAQKMWHNLRDSYRRKLKTRLEKKSGDCGKKDDNWPYFEAMDFLRNVLTPRESSGNITNIERNSTVVSVAQFTEDEDNDNVDNVMSQNQVNLGEHFGIDPSDEVLEISQTSKNGKNKLNKPVEKRANKRGYSDNDKLIEIESKKLQILTERFATKPEKIEDADTHFVLSLVEPLKELSSLQKMKVKSEIMNVITRALENKAAQESSVRFNNYSATPSPLSNSIGSMEECSSGIDNFAPNILSGHFPPNSQNQYNMNAGIFRRP